MATPTEEARFFRTPRKRFLEEFFTVPDFEHAVRLTRLMDHKYAYDPSLDNFPWPCCRPVKEDLARKEQEEMLMRVWLYWLIRPSRSGGRQ